MARLSPLFDALASPVRRQIMFALLDCGDDESIRIDSRGDLFDASRPRRLQTELRHVHLPYLSQYGFVEWDRNRAVIRRGPEFDAITEPLRALREFAEDNSTE